MWVRIGRNHGRWSKRARIAASKSVLYTFLCVGAVLFLFPVFWMVSTSLKSLPQVMEIRPRLIPSPVVWRNYIEVFEAIPYLRFMWNTLYLVLLNLIGALVSSPLVAYSFSRLRWSQRDFWFVVLLATMMLPGQVTLIPVYMIWKSLGALGTPKPLWVGQFLGNASFVFLLRQFMLTLPVELEEAARIDGCSPYGIYFRIILPLIKPALATIAVFITLGVWNDFLPPLIYLQREETYTLSLGLQFFRSSYEIDWPRLMAAATMMTVPALAIFAAAQRYFVKGIVMTGIKL